MRITALLFASSAFVIAAGASEAANLSVAMDEVRTITFAEPVKTVFVGNPVIADITVIDPRHVFLLGKNFGSTNLVALDADGNQTVNDQITVLRRSASTVTVQRGNLQTTLNCAGDRCESVAVPGDSTEPFNEINGQVSARDALASKAAGGGQ